MIPPYCLAISKQIEEEQAKMAAKPMSFMTWMSTTFALAVQQQKQQGSFSPPSVIKVIFLKINATKKFLFAKNGNFNKILII